VAGVMPKRFCSKPRSWFLPRRMRADRLRDPLWLSVWLSGWPPVPPIWPSDEQSRVGKGGAEAQI
jgi:hypothetical protein